MEIGFNDDVEYNDVTFHIQTEDHGQDDPRVSTQLFTGGRVLDNQTVSYGHLIADIPDEAERRVRNHTMRLYEHVRRTWTRLELNQAAARAAAIALTALRSASALRSAGVS